MRRSRRAPRTRRWARRVVEAAESSKGAAVKVDGRMVDRAVILLAERVLALASQTDAKRSSLF